MISLKQMTVFMGALTLSQLPAKDIDGDPLTPAADPPVPRFEIAEELGVGERGRTIAHEKGEITIASKPALTAADIRRATAIFEGGVWHVMVSFKGAGKDKLFQVSRKLAGTERRLVIIVKGKVVSAPVVREPLPGGNALITSDFAKEEAEALADAIKPKRRG